MNRKQLRELATKKLVELMNSRGYGDWFYAQLAAIRLAFEASEGVRS